MYPALQQTTGVKWGIGGFAAEVFWVAVTSTYCVHCGLCVELASESLRDLRIAEVSKLDLQLEDGKVRAYRARVKISFKYKGGD